MTDIECMVQALRKFPLCVPEYPSTKCLEYETAERMIIAAIAALADAGLVIVPRPATMEMRDAGLKAWRASHNKHEEQLLMDVHEAMMAAYTEKA